MFLINRVLHLALLIFSDYRVEGMPLTAKKKKSKLRTLSKIIYYHFTSHSFPSGYVKSDFCLQHCLVIYTNTHTYKHTHVQMLG